MEKKIRRKMCPMCKEMAACARKKCSSCSFDFKKGTRQQSATVPCTRQSGMTSTRLRTRVYESVREKSIYPLINRKRQQSMELDMDKHEEPRPTTPIQAASTPVEPTPPQSPLSPDSEEKIPVLKLKLNKAMTLSEQGDEKENTYMIQQTEDGESGEVGEIKEVVTMVTNEDSNNAPLVVDGDDVPTITTTPISTQSIQISAEALKNLNQNQDSPIFGHLKPLKFHENSFETLKKRTEYAERKRTSGESESTADEQTNLLESVAAQISLSYQMQMNNVRERGRPPSIYNAVKQLNNTPTTSNINVQSPNIANAPRKRGRPKGSTTKFRHKTAQQSHINMWNRQQNAKQLTDLEMTLLNISNKQYQAKPYQNILPANLDSHLAHSLSNTHFVNSMHKRATDNIAQSNLMGSLVNLQIQQAIQSLQTTLHQGPYGQSAFTNNLHHHSSTNQLNALINQLKPNPPPPPPPPPPQSSFMDMFNRIVKAETAKKPVQPTPKQMLQSFLTSTLMANSPQNTAATLSNNQHVVNQQNSSLLNNQNFLHSVINNSPTSCSVMMSNQQNISSPNINPQPILTNNIHLSPPMSIKAENPMLNNLQQPTVIINNQPTASPQQSFASVINNNTANNQSIPSFMSQKPSISTHNSHLKDLTDVLNVLQQSSTSSQSMSSLETLKEPSSSNSMRDLEQLISSLKTAPQGGMVMNGGDFIPRKRGRPPVNTLPGTASFEQHTPVIIKAPSINHYTNEKRTRGRPRKYPEHFYQVINGKMKYPGAKERKLYFPLDDYSSLSQLHIISKEKEKSATKSAEKPPGEFPIYNKLKEEPKETTDETTPNKKRGRPKGSKNKPNLLTTPDQILDTRTAYPTTSSVWAGLPNTKQSQLNDILIGINAKMCRQSSLNV